VNARPVAGDQKCIQGKFADHVAHLQRMAAGGESQGDIAFAQPFQRGERFSPRRWSGISKVPSISNAASFAMVYSPMCGLCLCCSIT
jgi:hypothetical protein